MEKCIKTESAVKKILGSKSSYSKAEITPSHSETERREIWVGIIAIFVLILLITASILYDKKHKDNLEDFHGTYRVGVEEYIIMDLLEESKCISYYSSDQGMRTAEINNAEITQTNYLTIEYMSGETGSIKYEDADRYTFTDGKGEIRSIMRISEAIMIPPDK